MELRMEHFPAMNHRDAAKRGGELRASPVDRAYVSDQSDTASGQPIHVELVPVALPPNFTVVRTIC
jgi:hypothetical protein